MRLGHWAGDGWRETEKSNFGWVCGEVQTLSPYATLSANTGAAQRPANKKNGRCRLHGGASTGAKTEEGRARISAANLRHGKFTKDKLEKRRENAAKGREIRKELRQMERELIAGGLLEKHWRDSFLT